MLSCLRIGFLGKPGETPEDALTELLRRLEGNGAEIVSISVLRPGFLPSERYEAYIVVRGDA